MSKVDDWTGYNLTGYWKEEDLDHDCPVCGELMIENQEAEYHSQGDIFRIVYWCTECNEAQFSSWSRI